MKNKKRLLIYLIISLVGFVLGYLLTNSYDFGLCYSDFNTNTYDVSCHSSSERVGNQLFYGMAALSAVFLFLMFFPAAFTAWKKFAVWFIPIATLLFIFYPDPGSGDFFSPYPEQVFKWVSTVYVIVSILIIYKSIQTKQ